MRHHGLPRSCDQRSERGGGVYRASRNAFLMKELEHRTSMTTQNLDVGTVQMVTGRLIPIMESVAQLLEDLAKGLPVSPQEDFELEGLRPYGLVTDVRGSLECAVNDCLKQAIRIMTEVRDQTEEGAARGW